MKLAFSAWAMREAPVETQIEIVRRAGYVGICLVSGADFSLDALTADATERRRIRRLLDDAHLSLTAVAGHANLLAPDAELRSANVARIKATLDLAADLAGSDTPPPVVSMGYGTPEHYAVDRGLLAERFSELADYAARGGGVVALEAHVGQAFDLPEKVAWLMRTVDSPSFRFNLDNSHFEVMGCDMDDYLPLLVPYSVHTDLKDQRGRYPEHQFLVPGEGDFDYARYLRTDELLSLQKSPEERVHHDELLFQTVHQSSELWLKLATSEVDEAAGELERDQLAAAIRLLRRAVLCMKFITDQIEMLNQMSPWEYHQIRVVLGHGSGFDSPGFRRVPKATQRLWQAFDQQLQRAGLELTELYFVVYQTLRSSPPIAASLNAT